MRLCCAVGESGFGDEKWSTGGHVRIAPSLGILTRFRILLTLQRLVFVRLAGERLKDRTRNELSDCIAMGA